MITINDYLNGILKDFSTYLDEGHELCRLKSVNYDQGQVPDYADIHVQQYYLLRYAYAYAFEYKKMYEFLFQRFYPQDQINVMSIGCGTMLDYWALGRILEQSARSNCRINYIGIDQIGWHYLIPARRRDTVFFCQNDVVDEFSQYASLDSDVYFFPKSISEFSDVDFWTLCKYFEETYIIKNQIHIMISVRSDERSMRRDLQRAELLRQAIIKNGFKTDDHCGSHCTVSNEDDKIRSVDSDFEHPAGVVDTLINLNARCAHYQNTQTNCQSDCTARLKRWPILNQKQIRFLILTFEREL